MFCLRFGFHGSFPRKTLVSGHFLQQHPPLHIIHLSTLPPLLNSWVFILLQFTMSLFMWPSRSFSVHCSLTAMLFALDCYNSVMLDFILGERVFTEALKGPLYEAWTLLQWSSHTWFSSFFSLRAKTLSSSSVVTLHNRWSWAVQSLVAQPIYCLLWNRLFDLYEKCPSKILALNSSLENCFISFLSLLDIGMSEKTRVIPSFSKHVFC